jgi:hypothetical protein
MKTVSIGDARCAFCDRIKAIAALLLAALLLCAWLWAFLPGRGAAVAPAATAAPVAVAATAPAAPVAAVAPSLLVPAAGAQLAAGNVTFSGRGEPGSQVEVVVDGTPVGQATVASDGTWTLNGAISQAGSRTVLVRTVAAVGAAARASAPATLNVVAAAAQASPTAAAATAAPTAAATAPATAATTAPTAATTAATAPAAATAATAAAATAAPTAAATAAAVPTAAPTAAATAAPVVGGVARVRVIHASPDAPAVDVLVNGQPVAALSNVPYFTASLYLELPAGPARIQVVPAGTTGPAVFETTTNLEADKVYTIAASGKLAAIGPVVFSDSQAAPAVGKAFVRVYHLAPDAPAVDVRVANGGPVLVQNLPFNQASGYLAVDGGTYDIEVVAAGTNNVVLRLPGTALQAGQIYDIFANGLLQGGPALAVNVQAFGAGSNVPVSLPTTSGEYLPLWLFLLIGATLLAGGILLRRQAC